MGLYPAQQISISVQLTADAVRLSMGIPAQQPLKPRLQRHIDEVLNAVVEHARPILVWRIGMPRVILDRVAPSRRLERFFQDADLVAIVVGSAGWQWQEIVARETDPMKAYARAVAATALARQTLVRVQSELVERYPEMQIGGLMSPGNGGLPLLLQRTVADLLPLDQAGIGIDDESLMLTPLASVSAFVVLRQCRTPLTHHDEIHVMPDCSNCSSSNCHIRIAPFQPTASLAC